MRYILTGLFIIALIIPSLAQIPSNGDGIVFDYDYGFRVKRYQDPNAPLLKRGLNEAGQQADTIIFDLNSKDKVNYVRAYPNPVYDLLVVENLSWKEGNTAVIKLSEISGKQTLEKKTMLHKEIISMGNVSPGTYTVSYFVNNVFIISWKIVKL